MAGSPQLTKEALERSGDILVWLARKSMGKNCFNEAGMRGLLQLIEKLVEPTIRYWTMDMVVLC